MRWAADAVVNADETAPAPFCIRTALAATLPAIALVPAAIIVRVALADVDSVEAPVAAPCAPRTAAEAVVVPIDVDALAFCILVEALEVVVTLTIVEAAAIIAPPMP